MSEIWLKKDLGTTAILCFFTQITTEYATRSFRMISKTILLNF